MSTISDVWDHPARALDYAPLLIIVAFVLHGAKTPLAFFIWSILALALAAQGLYSKAHPLRPGMGWQFFILIGCLLFSWTFSFNRMASTFKTSEALIFVLIWMAFQVRRANVRFVGLLWTSLGLCGVASLVITWYQYLFGVWYSACGWLPVNPLFNAMWMASVGTFFTVGGIHAFRRSPATARRRLVLGLGLCLTALAGPSRNAIVGLVIGLVYGLWAWITPRKILWMLASLLLIWDIFPNNALYLKLRLNEGNYRLPIWAIASHAIKDRPFVGYGPGNFEIAYQQYAFPVETDTIRFGRTTQFAHNEFLQVAAETGIPLFLLVIIGLCRIFLTNVKADPENERAAKAAVFTILVAAVYNPIWHMPLLLYTTLIWCWLLFSHQERKDRHPSSEGPSRWNRLHDVVWFTLTICLTLVSGSCALRDHWAQKKEWVRILSWIPFDSESLAGAAMAEPDRNRARSLLHEAVKQSPSQFYYHELYAAALEDSLNPSESMKEYALALRLAPTRALDYLGIGRLLYRQHRFKEAQHWFEQAHQIEPHYWESQLWLARCLHQLGQSNKALWILRHLGKSREDFLLWRIMYAPYLPTRNGASGYESLILSYDQRVVDNQIRRIETSKTNHLPRG